MRKTKARQPTDAQMKRWMDDLDTIRDEMAACDRPHLAGHLDSIAADIEADLADRYDAGPVVVWKGGAI